MKKKYLTDKEELAYFKSDKFKEDTNRRIMENKMKEQYYIPEISEFFIGYEFEEYCRKEWRKAVRIPEDWPYEWVKLKLDTSHSISRITSKIKQNLIRTPFLTKEQIEQEGWVARMNHYLIFEKVCEIPKESQPIGNVQIHYNFDNNYMRVSIDSGEFHPDYLFQGFCPSINEFKNILKYLNI